MLHGLTFRRLLDLLRSSADYESALSAVAHLALPTFGEWSIVDVVERPEVMRRVAIIHPDPAKQELVRALPAGWPPATEDPIGAPVVMRTRELHVVHQVTDEMLADLARNEENRRVLRQLGMGSFVVAPLVVGDAVLGAVTFVSGTTGRQYTEADLGEARELAALIALVVHNARLHRDANWARSRAQRTAEEATRQQRDLERVMDVQSRLVRGFSHDLKNPLGAALGYAHLLQTGIKGDLTAEQQASVERISASISSSLALIDDLVAYASRKMQKLDIQPGPTDVGQIVRQIAEEYEGQVQAAGLELSIEVAGEIPIIQSDRIRIRQVLGNLLSNAVKFTAGGRITVGAEVRQNDAVSNSGNAVALRVSDTGHGIPAEKQHMLFQEFARLEPTATAGVGLGLAISRSIARALGGDITVDSVQGQGSTFTLWVPLIPVREADGAPS